MNDTRARRVILDALQADPTNVPPRNHTPLNADARGDERRLLSEAIERGDIEIRITEGARL